MPPREGLLPCSHSASSDTHHIPTTATLPARATRDRVASDKQMPRKDRSEPTGSRKGPANKEPAAEGDEQQVCYLDNFLQGAWRGAKKQKPID